MELVGFFLLLMLFYMIIASLHMMQEARSFIGLIGIIFGQAFIIWCMYHLVRALLGYT